MLYVVHCEDDGNYFGVTSSLTVVSILPSREIIDAKESGGGGGGGGREEEDSALYDRLNRSSKEHRLNYKPKAACSSSNKRVRYRLEGKIVLFSNVATETIKRITLLP